MNIGYLFTGQGSQYKGMEQDFIRKYPSFKRIFEEASDTLHLNMPELCRNASEEGLMDTEDVQPLLLTYEMAAFETFKEVYELEPLFLAGHSLGEIAAITCAGGIHFAKALELVRERGRLMKVHGENRGGMSAVFGVSTAVLDCVCKEVSEDEESVVSISNYNSSRQKVISGNYSGIKKAETKLKKLHATVIPLKVNIPFHSILMEECAGEFEKYCRDTVFMDLKYPVISNLDGLPYINQNYFGSYLGKHIIHQVNWQKSIDYMYNSGVRYFVELGPGDTLCKMVADDYPDASTFAINKQENVNQFEELLKHGRFEAIKKSMGLVVSIKNENLDKKDYEENAANPYLSLQLKVKQLISDNKLIKKKEVMVLLGEIYPILKNKNIKEGEYISLCDKISSLYADL
ncbi:ACP S-malonyltransferase [Anaerocolumna xylanovorans]|uniref:[acyl-carrier-protein] S-malonyltransferase n=1 Tax=Anaerocolumna xylanovorans DSM 12503 TaxID=1121345 RepID=A0A1M7YMG1_9FIRM|nr:ACP S-malonyltransferase [Anaerocolumna xylanovorans]SHO53819.1 [acyl-carrier-protein] S-malonyltransferase [Anaerocolumna xylanovorans DSM 12503]